MFGKPNEGPVLMPAIADFATIVERTRQPIAQSQPMVQPTFPIVSQSREGSTMFKDHVEHTIARMHAPPQAQPLERFCTATLNIAIEIGTLDLL